MLSHKLLRLILLVTLGLQLFVVGQLGYFFVGNEPQNNVILLCLSAGGLAIALTFLLQIDQRLRRETEGKADALKEISASKQAEQELQQHKTQMRAFYQW
ncbi:MAG: hypothetical protein HC833_04040 [Leptolyngbyaceae cyanobacterium RM1_406_9]|nr:hypothetical protein [Leptolyngbyaceae cyanobacterium RM1_406_9]